MIELLDGKFNLICDHCEDSEDGFPAHGDAVQFKLDNSWKSIKGASGQWYELCPSCSTQELINIYRKK